MHTKKPCKETARRQSSASQSVLFILEFPIFLMPQHPHRQAMSPCPGDHVHQCDKASLCHKSPSCLPLTVSQWYSNAPMNSLMPLSCELHFDHQYRNFLWVLSLSFSLLCRSSLPPGPVSRINSLISFAIESVISVAVVGLSLKTRQEDLPFHLQHTWKQPQETLIPFPPWPWSSNLQKCEKWISVI